MGDMTPALKYLQNAALQYYHVSNIKWDSLNNISSCAHYISENISRSFVLSQFVPHFHIVLFHAGV